MTKALAPDAELEESHSLDRKSLRLVVGKAADWNELAQSCVCFANANGGRLLIGIEDAEKHPPPAQRIEPALIEKIQKRVGELTVNVSVAAELLRDENGGDFIIVNVARAQGVASTNDGRYFLRVADTCRPLVGDDVLRLVNERPAVPWERLTNVGVPRTDADRSQIAAFVKRVRASDRVKQSVREKSDDELLAHYDLVDGALLTNLGILIVGRRSDRAKLGSAPIVQAIKYDDRGAKVDKHVWDDYALSPLDLVDAIWSTVPDFRESYELPDGMFREKIPAFDEAVVRELVVNALVHRPYTQRGDIYLNLHPDHLEVVNVGRLPIGVTPRNVLHASRRRNEGLARIFHDVKLMEREGSGFDLMYEKLAASGRPPPSVKEGPDSVHVTVPRRLVKASVIKLIHDADLRYQLTQRERIALGLLAQSEGATARELASVLELREVDALRPWTSRLLKFGLVEQSGKTRGTRYFVPPTMLRTAGLDHRTTLKGAEPHRIRALVLQDVERYPDSTRREIHRRIGPEIHEKAVTRTLESLVKDGTLSRSGSRREWRYRSSRGQGTSK